MSDSERSPLLPAADNKKPDTRGPEESSESTPLLSSSVATPRYDGERDDVATGDVASVASHATDAPSATPAPARAKLIRWPSVIAMMVLAAFAFAVMVLAFIVPAAIEEYAKQATVIEPTNLSLVSLTSNGVRARIQANYRVDAQRVERDHVRRIGKTVGWLAQTMGSEETKINIYLPEYNNVLLGTAVVPPLTVSVVEGRTNEVDFVADLAPGDAEGIRTLANAWLEGRLNAVDIRGHADVQLKTGFIPLGTHSIVESLTFEGSKLPHLPEYNITKVNFKEQPVPGESDAMAAEVSIKSFNEYPVSVDVPELAFEVLVPGCSSADPYILVVSATTSRVALRPHADVVVDARGLITELPDSLVHICPNSDSSPLDMFFEKYLGGEPAIVLVRGQKRPVGDTPEWLAEILSSIAVPVPFPGRSFDNLIRSFSLTDVQFKLPEPQDPDGPWSKPRVSGTILVVAGLPSEMNFSLNVTAVRADADVFYRGDKLGELDVKKWNRAHSTQIPATDDSEATLKIESSIHDAPLNVTDADVLTDVIQALLFGNKEIMLSVKALVDVKVQTILGELVVKAVPAEGKIPVQPLGKDLFGSATPVVRQVRITDTTPSSLSLEANVRVFNPTPYGAYIPFVSVLIESNGTTIGEAFARGIGANQHGNISLNVHATWDPSMGGEQGRLNGRNLLSQYISGYNTTVTIRTHAGTFPNMPSLGKALSRLNITLPAPRLKLPGGDDDDGNNEDDNNGQPHFIRSATFHILSSTASFMLANPLRRETLFIDAINATALYNHTEPVGRIFYDLPFAAPPGDSRTPRLPVDWSLDSVGYDRLKEALGGTMKLDARAEVDVRLGRWRERVWFVGRGIGAGVRL